MNYTPAFPATYISSTDPAWFPLLEKDELEKLKKAEDDIEKQINAIVETPSAHVLGTSRNSGLKNGEGDKNGMEESEVVDEGEGGDDQLSDDVNSEIESDVLDNSDVVP